MKIIALEEHTIDRAIGAATAEVCKNNVPYLDTFYRADMPATPTADSLFKMGEYRLADMDRCGIDIEVLSLASYSQCLGNAQRHLRLRQHGFLHPQTRHRASALLRRLSLHSARRCPPVP